MQRVRLARSLGFAAFLLIPGAPAAAQDRAPTVRDLLEVRSLGEPRLSPDGKRIVFVVRSADADAGRFRRRLYVATTGTGDARPLTREGLDAHSPRWSPSGAALAFIAPAAPEDGDGDGKPQVWLLPGDGGEARVLTRAPEGVRAFAWTPDGRAVVYLAREPRAAALRAWDGRRRARRDDAHAALPEARPLALWRRDVAPDGRAERLFVGDPGIREIALSPDGRRLAYTTNYTGLADDDTDLWIVDLGGGEPRRLTSREGSESSPVFSPDGRSLVFRAAEKPELSYSQADLFLIDVEGGEPRSLTADFDRAVLSFDWPARTRRILFTAAAGTRTHLFRLEPRRGTIDRTFTGGAVVGGFTATPDGDDIYVVASSPTTLQDLYAVEGRERLRRITRLNAALERDVAWARQEVLRWTSFDGTAVEGVVTYPLDYEPGRRYPLVLEIHGGPYGRVVDALPGRAFAQLWAARGYLVLQPNFRGSQGYGEAFGIANRGDLGGGDYRDLMTGVDTLIARGLVDPDRMGVTGGSYGGYMTNWIIGQTDRFAAAISLYGIFSLVTDFSNSNIPSWERGYLGGWYWEDPEPYRKHSPMTYVRNVRTPVLILHGEADDNTFVANSNELYQALRLMGREVEYVLYPREGHGIGREPNHVVDKWNRMRRWFDARVLYRGRADRMVYEVGDSVPADPAGAAADWLLRVTRAAPAGGYAGDTTRHLEVELLLSAAAGAPALDLVLTGAAADVRLERDGARPLTAAGVPVSTLGPAVLVAGAGQRVRLAAKPGEDAAAAVALAFPLPAPGRWKLRVAGFPAVALDVPGRPAPAAAADGRDR